MNAPEITRGMKGKTIKAILAKKFEAFVSSIDDEAVKHLVRKNTVITGGCIASMLLGEKVNDYDLYFTDRATCVAVGNYYVGKFVAATGHPMQIEDDGERVRIVTSAGHRGETAGDVATLEDSGEIEDRYEDINEKAQETEADETYRPVFMSTNAITLSDRIQIVLRFYGEPDTIHENYDFVHCTNYWLSRDRSLTLRQPALEALLCKELRYVGSKYPVCSVIRLRKFIKRGWTINAGQILKAVMQISELDLTDPKVLEDQLTGVDSAYFMEVMRNLREKDPEKVNAAYLVEIIDRMF
ncbi:hypothetical protein [Sphingomonas sp. SRS2]|uniref:hypothetical protein n=1 Tax=Sphingomonas sp. SRS2 TaxID=133190 RepID=UPI000AC51037|nr:hypothetical protein [Sphingomonas sp. SRS2]